jgi:hypothetical protein
MQFPTHRKRLLYKDQLANAVLRNNHCLQWESYENWLTHSVGETQSSLMLTEVVYIVTIVIKKVK